MPRKLERTPLLYHLRVLGRTTDKIFGYLGNLTPEGLLLFCPDAVELNVLFALNIILPGPISGVTQIPLDASSVWCLWDERLGMYAAGFRLESPDPNSLSLITDTIALLGSKAHTHRQRLPLEQ